MSGAEIQAESAREPLPAPAAKPRKKHPGRQELPADLPRVEKVIASAPEQCTCKACGKPTVVWERAGVRFPCDFGILNWPSSAI